MGLLVDGEWRTDWYDTKNTGGHFVRKDSSFRNWVKRDGSSPFPAEAGRYHLYVSLACPWAHRTLILRRLKGLESAIGLSVVEPLMSDDGWEFSETPGSIPDTVNGARFLRDIYVKADPQYHGRVTVPVLWDKLTNTIVSNESAEIIRMFNSEFADVSEAPSATDYYPANLREQIEQINAPVYEFVNNGVYRAGFATTQAAYDQAVTQLFETLDELEARLASTRYLVGDQITLADWRLFTTLVRFDAVYHGHFKCNLRRVADYPNLQGFTRELFQIPGVAETVNLDHIKRHYYWSHTSINPHRVVPSGPVVDFLGLHGRN